jgi:hypothetical protein
MGHVHHLILRYPRLAILILQRLEERAQRVQQEQGLMNQI